MTDVRAEEVHGLNIVAVKPENQQKVIEALRGMGPIEEIPGLHSLQLLRSADGTKLLNYMRWESIAAFQQASQHPRIMAAIEEAAQFAEEPGNPGFYHVVYTHE